MTLFAFAMLLLTTLLQPCACDMQALRAQVARKLKESKSASPDVKELHERIDRQLTQTFSQECFSACPDLQSLEADITTATMSLMESSGLSSSSQPSQSDMMELMDDLTEILLDAYCAHRPAVECLADNPIACAGSEDHAEFAPKLDCLCDKCPSAKSAVADATGMLMAALASAFSGASSQTSSAEESLEDMTDEELQMVCSLYPLFSCSVDFPAECGNGVLFDGLDVSDMTGSDDSLAAQLEGMCPSTTDDNDDNDDTDDTDAEASNCGPISPGWFSVSMLLAVAALTLETV